MKVSLSVKVLQELLDLTARFVSKHATLPILENIYIKGNIDTLLLRATDMEKYIEIEIPAEIENEGAVTVNAKTFYDIIRSIDDETVLLHVDTTKDILDIHASSDKFKIKGIAASEYVAVPTIQSENTLTLSTQSFTTGINKVEFAVTEKNFSPVLTGVFMRTKEYEGTKHMVFVGTDSFRLAEYKTVFDGQSEQDFSCIVPKVHIADINKVAQYMLEKEVETMQITLSDNMVRFGFSYGDMQVSCMSLLIQGTFPDYENENIMPTTFNTTVLLDKTQLEKAIRKIAILTRDINNYIAVQGGDNQLIFTSGETDMGEGKTSCAALIDNEMASFGMNGKYIADFLKNIEGIDVQMALINAEKPVIFKDKDDTQFTYVVRPLMK